MNVIIVSSLCMLSSVILLSRPAPHVGMGLVTDWTHHHVLYPESPDAFRMARIRRDPRWMQGWYHRHPETWWREYHRGYGGPEEVKYARYVDPAEHAFTVQAPIGWRVGGRMVRYGPISIAPFVQAMAPDGAIFIQLGDWHIKDYCDIPGWPEGHLYTPGTSVEFVRRVQSAEQYAHSYALDFAKQLGCGNPAFTSSQSLPAPPGVAALPQARLETNLTEFNCRRGGQAYGGRVIVSVEAYRLPTSIGWNILYLASGLARQDRAAAAFGILDTMRSSFAFDPAWNAREAVIARQATRPAMDALNATLGQAQDFDKHVINGLVTVNDPATGRKWDVGRGAAPFYFTDGQGHFYNSYDPTPRGGYHTVNTVP